MSVNAVSRYKPLAGDVRHGGGVAERILGKLRAGFALLSSGLASNVDGRSWLCTWIGSNFPGMAASGLMVSQVRCGPSLTAEMQTAPGWNSVRRWQRRQESDEEVEEHSAGCLDADPGKELNSENDVQKQDGRGRRRIQALVVGGGRVVRDCGC